MNRRKHMRNWKVTRHLVGLICAVSCVMVCSASVFAEPSRSTHFELSEPEFGAGAALNTCSGKYCAKATIGSMTANEETRSDHVVAFSEDKPDDGPTLEVIIEPGISDLGVLSTDKTATKTTVIKIRSYKSDGYSLQLAGASPHSDAHQLAVPVAPEASTPGKEQFGINAVANTTPAIGTNPVVVIDGKSSAATIEPRYASANKFTYASNDVIAYNRAASSQSEYTLSMIVNISPLTPAGDYNSTFTAIIVPYF